MRRLGRWILRHRMALAIVFFLVGNHLIDWGPFNLLVTFAQTTQVTGQVLDTTQIPYAGAQMKAQLVFAGTPVSNPTVTISVLSQCRANGFGSAPCQVPFTPSNGPFNLDSAGNIPGGGITLQDNTQVTPSGTQWAFSVNTAGNPPPLGTGPQTCSATLTISGASQIISSSFAACPKLSNAANSASKFDTNGVYVATNCGGASNCVAVNDNVLVSQNVSYSNGSGGVTTLASDPAFVAQAGLIAFAAGRCTGDVSRCFTDCPQSSLTVVSAHSATLSNPCTNTSSGTANANNLAWGLDDGPSLVNAFNLLFPLSFASTGLIPQPTKALFLPCGMMFTSVNPFITNVTLSTQGGAIQGCGGGGGTVIIPLPKMNGTSTGGALFADNGGNLDNNGRNLAGWHLRDFSFWGLGGNVKDASATFTASEPGIFLNITDEMDNVWVIGWLWADASTPIGVLNLDGLMVNSGSFAGGYTPCVLQANLGVTSTMIGGSCGGATGTSLVFSSAANQAMITVGVYVNQSFGTGFGTNNAGGIWNDYGSHDTQGHNNTGGVSLFHGSLLDQFGGGHSALVVASGSVHLVSTQLIGSGAIITQTGGTIFDDCGNVLGGTAGVFTANGVVGSCSLSQEITNPAVASRNTTLGTTQLLPTNRFPGPDIVIELYAYDSAAGASCTGNTTVLWTISYTDPTGTAQTSTATETITTNGGSTGGDALKVLFPISVNSGTVVNYSATYTIGTGCVTGPSFASQLKVI
jgi:hypothetical protein